MYIEKFVDEGLLSVPKFCDEHLIFEAITGSRGFGIENENSDWDIFGICIPPDNIINPYNPNYGFIYGLGTKPPTFECVSQDLKFEDNQFQINIYSITKFMNLVWQNSPRIIEILFSKNENVTLRLSSFCCIWDNRKLFLSKRFYNKFVKYAENEINSLLRVKQNRQHLHDKFGYDTKSAVHAIRLLDEVEQILSVGDLDIQKNKDFLRCIREGAYSYKFILQEFKESKERCEYLLKTTKLPDEPNEDLIKQIALLCVNRYRGCISQ